MPEFELEREQGYLGACFVLVLTGFLLCTKVPSETQPYRGHRGTPLLAHIPPKRGHVVQFPILSTAKQQNTSKQNVG